MSLITGQRVIHNYGQGDVLKNVDFSLPAGARVGLVGPNGEGKTTLLRIIAGLLAPSAGAVQRRRGLTVGYLPQDPPPLAGATLRQAMDEVFADLRRTHEAMDALAGDLADPAALNRYAALQHEFETAGGYTTDVRINTVLTGLGFSPDECDRPVTGLSGGQRTRAMLGRLLLQAPDVLLLDEPTNHLDMRALEWLERYLGEFRKALVVVSHDRYFLDRITTSTWEIAFGGLEVYRGNYTAHRAQRAHRFAERMSVWQAQQEYIRKTEEFIRRHHAASRAKEARGRRTRLERFLKDEAIDKPQQHRQIHLRLAAGGRSGELVLQSRSLTVGYDPARPLLTVPDLKLQRRQRVAILGGNGVGKTTLLRTLRGDLAPLAGTIRQGAGVVAGYLPQTHDQLDPEMTALEAVIRASAGALGPEQARTLLGSLLLSDDDVFKPVGQLSGGQRSRVILATLAIQGASLLLLDEPTNHLDIPSQEALQEALGAFEGTVIFVSHDRYLIDAVATQIWAIDGGQVHPVWGNWEAFLEWRARQAAGAPDPEPDPGKRAPARAGDARDARKQRQRLQRQQQKLEDEIHALEARLAGLTDAISQASMDRQIDKVHELGADYQQAEAELKRLWDRWAEVTEVMEP